MSVEGWARKNPLIPPLTNTDTKPSANSEAPVKRSRPPYTVPIHNKVTIVAGIVITSVGTENSVAENGFIPLRNMWWPQTV